MEISSGRAQVRSTTAGPSKGPSVGYAFGLDSAFAALASFAAAGFSSLPPAGFASLPVGGFASLAGTAFEAKPDRKSTRLNSSHDQISYAVFCLKKKNNT